MGETERARVSDEEVRWQLGGGPVWGGARRVAESGRVVR